MDSDLGLLDRWCAGDKTAGNELFTRHFASVREFFERKTDRDADDLVQETFLACVHSRDRFRRQSSFRTYVFAIARNVLFGYWRRVTNLGEAVDFSQASISNLVTSVRTQIARGQDHERLLAALAELPLEQQLLLELHYWEGLDAAQLAEVFDIAPTTSRTRLHRARSELRDLLERSDDDAPFDQWARSMRPTH